MMLPGIRIQDVKKMVDERGFFAEVMRDDWKPFLEGDNIVQANLSSSFPRIIRAWHRHNRGQVDYLIVLKGSMRICAYDDTNGSPTRGELSEITVSDQKPQIVRVPGYYWHGTKTLGVEPSLTLYLVTRLYDASDPDEERRPWNDNRIIDPRTAKPFDWNRPTPG